MLPRAWVFLKMFGEIYFGSTVDCCSVDKGRAVTDGLCLKTAESSVQSAATVSNQSVLEKCWVELTMQEAYTQ